VNWGPPGDAQDLLSPACLTPAQVMAHLAEKVIDILDPVAQGIFTAPAFIPVTHEELTNAIRRATPAVAAASPAAQYKDLVQQHQAQLPTGA